MRPLLFDLENPYLDIAYLNITYIIFLTKIKDLGESFQSSQIQSFDYLGELATFYRKYINYFVYKGVTCYLQKIMKERNERNKCPKAYLITFKDTLEAYFWQFNLVQLRK